jgi:hypothetical protein
MRMTVYREAIVSALFASAFTPALAMAASDFVIDASKPYVYVKFDHKGDRKPAAEDEGTKGLWLHLVNNCRLPINVVVFDLGTGDPGVGVNYSVVPLGGIHGPSVDQREKMPHGFHSDTGTTVDILPGRYLLFSIPSDRVGKHWYIQVRFDFTLPGPMEGYHPYSLVDFMWEDIPKGSRSPFS